MMSRFGLAKLLLVILAVIAGIALAGALAVHLYGAHRLSSASHRFEREAGPLSPQTLVRPPLPPERNAVTWLRPGVLAAVLFPGDQGLVGSLHAKPYGEWPDGAAAQLRAILDRNAPAIALLTQARGLRESNWDIAYGEGTTAKIPNLLAAMNVSKLLTARGRLALALGDRETALESAEILGALARSHEAEPATIVLLVGLAIEKNEIALAHEIVASGETTPPELNRLAAALPEQDLEAATRQTFRGSAAAIVQDVERGSLFQEIHGVLYRKIARPLARLFAASAIEAHRGAEREVGTPVKAPLDAGEASDRESGWWTLPGHMIAPNLSSVAARATATASARQLARLSIALRREALVLGRYPASLPSIDGIPPDDPLTGTPRTYEVRADGAAELRSTTSAEIVHSIAPGSQLAFDALYLWMLPAPSRTR